jgi:hypothetical protein
MVPILPHPPATMRIQEGLNSRLPSAAGVDDQPLLQIFLSSTMRRIHKTATILFSAA